MQVVLQQFSLKLQSLMQQPLTPSQSQAVVERENRYLPEATPWDSGVCEKEDCQMKRTHNKGGKGGIAYRWA